MADKKISQLTSATTPLAGSEVLPIVQSGATVKVSINDLTAGKDVSMRALTSTRSDTDNTANFSATGASTGVSNVLSNGNGTSSAKFAYTRYINNQTVTQDWRIGTYGSDSLSIVNATAGTIPLVFDTSGNATISNGNLVIGTSGKGIDFSADGQAAGMTSELLDDYEEGTWTPAFDQFTVGNGSVAGKYTKIGRVVSVLITLDFGSTSSWAGTCTAISNFPFASTNRSVGLIAFFKSGTGWYSGQTVINSGATSSQFPARYDNVIINATNPFTWAANDYLVIQLTYEA